MPTQKSNPFKSREHPPTDSEIQLYLGDDRNGLWQTVVRELGRFSDATELHWSGASTGWTWRFSRREKTMALLIPNGLCFAAFFQMDSSHRLALEQVAGDDALAIIQRAKACQDGKWVEWPVYTREDAQLLVKTLRAKAQLAGEWQ